MISLFNEKKDCCGCMACMNICPKQAIRIKKDEDGFVFPVIDPEKCVGCELCKKVCSHQNVSVKSNKPIATYVAINKNEEVLLSSSSGGAFGALANMIFEKNGVVFGCAYNDNMKPQHICVNNLCHMKRVHGSKYVQSDINTTYTMARKYLNNGTLVLFSGTPCQIAGLKSYLDRDYENLITVDIICHGVPGADFFMDYIKHLEEKLKGKIIDLKFRDKSKAWGLRGKIIYKKNGKIKEKILEPQSSYYYNYFLKGETYREACYECKYACGIREGDFTIGDYWGIEKVHPEIDPEKGVSVLLVNTKKGILLVDELSKYLNLTESTFDKARMKNGQLNRPSAKSDKRDSIFETWRKGGYKAVAKKYKKENKWHFRKLIFKMFIPSFIIKQFNKIVGRK